LQQPELAAAYREVQRASYGAVTQGESSRADYEDRINRWFQSMGYATTASAVTEGMKGVRAS